MRFFGPFLVDVRCTHSLISHSSRRPAARPGKVLVRGFTGKTNEKTLEAVFGKFGPVIEGKSEWTRLSVHSELMLNAYHGELSYT